MAMRVLFSLVAASFLFVSARVFASVDPDQMAVHTAQVEQAELPASLQVLQANDPELQTLRGAPLEFRYQPASPSDELLRFPTSLPEEPLVPREAVDFNRSALPYFLS